MLEQIINRQSAHCCARFNRRAAHMWEQNSVRKIAQRLRYCGLSFKHIKSGPTQRPALQSLYQRGFVDN